MTNGKMAVMFGILFSYFFLLILVLNNTTYLIPAVVLTFMYVIVLYYMVRFYMFEESRLKRTVEELDKNKIVSPNHFNAVQNVTTEGMIKYQYELEIKFALVVYVQRGSKVGVPEGFMEEQVDVYNRFIQDIHRKGWNYDRYELSKESEISDILKHSSNRLLKVDNELLAQFQKLQVEALQVYSTGDTNEIVDYFVIYNTKPSTLPTFMELVEEMVGEHFEQSMYFNNVKLLDKEGVEKFFKSTVMLDNFDLQNVKRTVETSDLEDFAVITREFDQYGEEVVSVEGGEVYQSKGKDDVFEGVEREIERERKIVEAKEKEFFSKQKREHKRFDNSVINKEQLAYREYEIFDELFDEDDLEYISNVMDGYYNNWKTHKMKLEEDLEDVIELEDDYAEDIDLSNEEYGNSEVSYDRFAEDDYIILDEDEFEDEDYEEDELEIDEDEVELPYGFLDGERIRK